MGSLKSLLLLTAKLAFAGAIIFAIGWAVMVYQPDGTVRQSQADILDFNVLELSEEARFARGLGQLGHDEPQSFDINGNVVNFSINYSSKRPLQLAKEYQEEFVYQGLNEKVWEPGSTFESHPAMQMAAMTGGVVPLDVSDTHALLGGVSAADGSTDAAGLEKLATTKDPHDRKIFSSHRVIRMLWDAKKLRSTITATWGNQDFDYRKMVGNVDRSARKKGSSLDVDTDVPACPGCRRVNRVRDLDPSRQYSNNIFAGSRSQSELFDFYRRAMTRRGWIETDSSRTFNAARPYIEFEGDEASMIQFAKNARFLTITGFPGRDGQTVVHTTMSD